MKNNLIIVIICIVLGTGYLGVKYGIQPKDYSTGRNVDEPIENIEPTVEPNFDQQYHDLPEYTDYTVDGDSADAKQMYMYYESTTPTENKNFRETAKKYHKDVLTQPVKVIQE